MIQTAGSAQTWENVLPPGSSRNALSHGTWPRIRVWIMCTAWFNVARKLTFIGEILMAARQRHRPDVAAFGCVYFWHNASCVPSISNPKGPSSGRDFRSGTSVLAPNSPRLCSCGGVPSRYSFFGCAQIDPRHLDSVGLSDTMTSIIFCASRSAVPNDRVGFLYQVH